MKDFIKKWWLIILSSAILAATVGLGAVIILPAMAQTTILAEGTGRNNLNFSVHYVRNNLFPENPIPADLHFIRHLTDFIQLESSFSADFSERFDLIYSYRARKVFRVTHSGAGGANPVIYQRIIELSEAEGRTTAGRLEFNSENIEGEPGGTYFISPDEYLRLFNQIAEFTGRPGTGDEGGGPALRGLSGELVVEFTYSVRALPVNINESLTRSIRIPISQDVFTLEAAGTPGFTATVAEQAGPAVSMIQAIALGLGIVIGSGGLALGIYRLSYDDNEERRKANDIIKKYGSEIVIAKRPLDLKDYQVVKVLDFEDLIKLAINLNKHITCYKDDEQAAFYVIVDGFAYCLLIKYLAKYASPKEGEIDTATYVKSENPVTDVKIKSITPTLNIRRRELKSITASNDTADNNKSKDEGV